MQFKFAKISYLFHNTLYTRKNHDLTESVLTCFTAKVSYIDRKLLVSGRVNKRRGILNKGSNWYFQSEMRRPWISKRVNHY